MGALRLLSQLYGGIPEVKPLWIPLEVDETIKGRPILRDAVNVTLAEYDLTCKDAITAHNLKDYRQRTFKLALLPKCEILFDKVLEGSEYWSELLHTKVHFS